MALSAPRTNVDLLDDGGMSQRDGRAPKVDCGCKGGQRRLIELKNAMEAVMALLMLPL